MINDWYESIELPISIEQFWRLPKNAAYKYEYFDGHAYLSPRPKSQHAVLDLQTFLRPIDEMAAQEELAIRPLQEADWATLPKVFAAAFHNVQPFASLPDEDCLAAAAECLSESHQGAEGPLVESACLAATRKSDDGVVGATVITLPPAHAVYGAEGLPHLTWIFVGPWHARCGVGCALLDEAVRELLKLGYTKLASTFLLGNDSSTLWHWKAGFRLLEDEWSLRKIRRRG
jgi:hypothetical protein